jgi:hAT family C-terminal dimerisation region
VRKWWLLPEQQRDYPNLSKMALDILSIPAMSASIERLFSSANMTVSDRRNRLTPDTIEMIECLKSWQKLKEVV